MKSINLSKINILNLLVCLFPLTFILGSLFINLVIFLIIFSGILLYKNKLLSFNKNYLLAIIGSFFILLIISTFVEQIRSDTNHVLKSALYLRYLFLLVILRFMILNNLLNIKQFLLSCLILSIFVAADVIFQFIVGVNIIGFKPPVHFYQHPPHNYPGIFGLEAISGGYIQRFLVLGLFALPLLFYKNQKKTITLLVIAIIIGFIGIIISGNRIPSIMFLFFIFLFFIFFSFKKLKFFNIISLIFILSVSTFILKNNEGINKRYQSFKPGVIELFQIFPQIKKNYPELEKYKNTGKPFHETEGINNIGKYEMLENSTGHTSIYITSIDIFKESPFIGRGIKSFRNACREFWHLPNRTCQTHPHNFFLEILNDTGIFGLGFLGITLIILFFKNFNKYYRRYRGEIKNTNFLFYGVAFALLLEFVPLRSHGSFFSTSNASYIFLLIGIFIGLYDLNLKKKSKK